MIVISIVLDTSIKELTNCIFVIDVVCMFVSWESLENLMEYYYFVYVFVPFNQITIEFLYEHVVYVRLLVFKRFVT
jgi:hypothetical protein